MSTKKSAGFDYQSDARKQGPNVRLTRRGTERRSNTSEVSKQRITIRIDDEILEQFKQLVPSGRGYQSLINHALREWLAARGVKELVREELREVIEEVVSKAVGP